MIVDDVEALELWTWQQHECDDHLMDFTTCTVDKGVHYYFLCFRVTLSFTEFSHTFMVIKIKKLKSLFFLFGIYQICMNLLRCIKSRYRWLVWHACCIMGGDSRRYACVFLSNSFNISCSTWPAILTPFGVEMFHVVSCSHHLRLLNALSDLSCLCQG